jgi:hypothetical protein
MATLTVARRKTLAREGKANPNGGYPTDTKGRAVAAKGRATDAVKAGRMSDAEEKKIDARANRELGKRAPKAPRAGATDGMGGGKGALALHSSVRGSNMHSDASMYRERY